MFCFLNCFVAPHQVESRKTISGAVGKKIIPEDIQKQFEDTDRKYVTSLYLVGCKYPAPRNAPAARFVARRSQTDAKAEQNPEPQLETNSEQTKSSLQNPVGIVELSHERNR